MDWIKKHVDTVIVLVGILSSLIWMNGKFNHIDHEMSKLDKEISIVKTVLIMRNIMPNELAHDQEYQMKPDE